MKFIKFLIAGDFSIIHTHTGRWPIRVLIGLIGLLRRKKVLFTAHSHAFCEDFQKGNVIKKALLRFVLKKSYIIAVNPTIRDELIQMGVLENNCEVIPAFIPPPQNISESDIPVDVRRFCQDKTPLLSACGAWVKKEGVSTYGLEMLLPMMKEVLKQYPKAGLVVYMGGMFGSNPEDNDFVSLQKQLKQSPWNKHVLFFTSKEEFYPALTIADVFLRPTFTDGDAVSVREALSMNVPVIASQTHARPEGVHLFNIGNQPEFNQSVLGVLADLEQAKKKLQELKHPNSTQKILKVYEKLLSI